MKVAGSGEFARIHASVVGRLELKWLNRWAKKILILNPGMREDAINYGISADKLEWMPNPVDTITFSPGTAGERRELFARFGIPETTQIVMYSGRLAPEKGLNSLLDAFALVAKSKPNVLLVLIGEGSMRAALCERARRLYLSGKVLFAGRVEPEQVSVWLKMADVFSLVSPAEGFSCALAEAMSAGLPSVVTDIPANRQLIVDGQQGFLVPVGAVECIRSAILRLLENSSLRHRMGNRARACIVENYSTAWVTERYESLLHNVVHNS